MTQLISLDNASLSFGPYPLLDKAKLQIESSERLCLIGRNGAGKSTLLKVIEGSQKLDDGTIWRKPALKIARLEQELPQYATGTVYDFVAQGLAKTGELLAAYHHLTQNTLPDLKELERLQHLIDAENGWQFDQSINNILSRLSLDAEARVSELSGGWQRRVVLARALVIQPELLLLDEPTNHLDIEAIEWLENQLINSNVGLLFITHDRSLLQRLATRIIELDRGQLTSWPGDYENFLRRKEEMLHAEAKANIEFDKKLAEEEIWIRQGIKARRTRNEGRVRALKALRLERSKRITIEGKTSFDLNLAEKSGQLVIEANHISHYFSEKCIVRDFSIRVMRGDRIALLGPNGIGKSTLLGILLDKIKPQEGHVTHGTNLKIAYFDQLRQTIDMEKSVYDNVAQGSDTVEINGKSRHVFSYLNDFLFTPDRIRTPVKALSGGECNRLLLACLFSKPSNLLVLDEPTNDLDIETLEMLEDLLSEYQGTLLLVSHDRVFIDNVVSSTLAFEGDGKIQEYVGGYQDWLRQRKTVPEKKQDKKIVQEPKTEKPKTRTKLSYKEQKELDELPSRIENLEEELNTLQNLVANPDFYKNTPDEISNQLNHLKNLEQSLEDAYSRWDELSGL
ncbi:MAG: ATP-binding cassette domain-containing protein [Gammaproteobacteria bacterium]